MGTIGTMKMTAEVGILSVKEFEKALSRLCWVYDVDFTIIKREKSLLRVNYCILFRGTETNIVSVTDRLRDI
jgi:hypothetical protein